MTPTIGQIVHYTLTNADAERINKRRNDAIASGTAGRNSGAIVHFGNRAAAGETYPMIITRVWAHATELALVNGQVWLDGNDTLWATSVRQGPGEGHYVWLVTE